MPEFVAIIYFLWTLTISQVSFLPGGEVGSWELLCWNALILRLSCIHTGCVRVGAKQLSLAKGDLSVNSWMKTEKCGFCDFWSLTISAKLCLMCEPLMAAAWGWRQGNVSDSRCVCLCRQKDDEMGCVALPREAVCPLNRVDLCCEQTPHQQTALSLSNTTSKPLSHPCWISP